MSHVRETHFYQVLGACQKVYVCVARLQQSLIMPVHSRYTVSLLALYAVQDMKQLLVFFLQAFLSACTARVCNTQIQVTGQR